MKKKTLVLLCASGLLGFRGQASYVQQKSSATVQGSGDTAYKGWFSAREGRI